jgi:hypothetical protein
MNALRLLLVAAVVAAVAALVVWVPDPVEPSGESLDRAVVPAAFDGGAVSGTWYCAASSIGSPEPPRHRVILTNPGPDAATARATAYATAGPLPPATVEVPASGSTTIDVQPTFGAPELSVVVESAAPGLVVEHRLNTDTDSDQVPCATSTSDRWWFPALNSARGSSALLTLFNPFPADAGVDVEVVLDASARTPAELSGIVVPARSVKVVDLGAVVQRRDVFAVVVRSRSGRVVAEATQRFDGTTGPRGVRMQLGVPGESSRWSFAGGFTGSGVGESVVVVNPTGERVSAEVRVVPYGAATTAPEPFVLDIPSLRYAVVDLSAESRVPAVGFHAVSVVTDGAPVVAALLSTITGPPAPPAPAVPGEVPPAERPALGSGVGITTGSPVAAAEWLVPALDADADPAPVVFVHNPGATPVTVNAVPVEPGLDAAARSESTTVVEIAPGDAVALDVPRPAVPGTAVGLRISAGSPVVVERFVTYPGQDEFAIGLAVPYRTLGTSPVPLPSG